MTPVDSKTILQQLSWRYACKKFDPAKKISDQDWHVLTQALWLSASSHGLQPWKFLVIQNSELRQKLLPLSWNQSPVVEASHFIVFTYKERMDEEHIQKYVDQVVKIRGVEPSTLDRFKNGVIQDLLTGPRNQMIEAWSQRQTYIAMGSLLTTTSMLGIDTLAMEGLDSSAYDKALDLVGTGWKTVAAVACGYRAPEDKYQHFKKVRFDIHDVIEYR